jgi:hypothetical protein
MKNILRPRQGLSKRTLASGDTDLQGPLRETLHRLQTIDLHAPDLQLP